VGKECCTDLDCSSGAACEEQAGEQCFVVEDDFSSCPGTRWALAGYANCNGGVQRVVLTTSGTTTTGALWYKYSPFDGWQPVQVVRNSDNVVLCQGTRLGNGNTHTLQVDVVAGSIRAYDGGALVVSCDVTADLPKNPGVVGFTAASGGDGYRSGNSVSGVAIRQRCGGKPGGVCQ
jgi:hypothetical protein